MKTEPTSVLVVGAGVGGIRAALDLAEVGYKVRLIDQSPHIGGILAELDYQFPNNHCGMCRMLPMVDRESASQYCMRKGLFHENIDIMPFTEVVEVSGEPGAFAVDVVRKTRQVNTDRCIGCGTCVDVCPVEVDDEFNEGLAKRKAIFRPVPQNIPNMYIIDQNHCTKCGKCMIHCPTQAVDLFVVDTHATLEVGAIIFAGGTGFFDPRSLSDQYGFGEHPDVLTSLQFERLISNTGPTGGRLIRPSDGKEIESIAWLQCVGSRNLKLQRDFCSSICCMFALKEAMLAKDIGGPRIDTAIYYMDMRCFEKGGYRYQKRAEEEKGVRFVRSRVHTVTPDNGGLAIRYVDEDGSVLQDSYDLVVLSTGQSPQEDFGPPAEKLGITLNEWGFAESKGFSLVSTENPGVFVCGSVTGLKEISETLVQAGAASAEASRFLTTMGLSGTPYHHPGEERDFSRERPKIDVVLCKCMGGVEEVLDFPALKARLAADPRVAAVIEADELCEPEGFERVVEALQGSTANRLLIAACSPYVYRKTLREVGAALGLNPALVEVVDLRGLALSGKFGIVDAEKRATILLKTAIEKLKGSDPLYAAETAVTQTALVVGAGIAGMTAALQISQAGYPVILVEKEGEIGGRLPRIYHTLDGEDPRRLCADTIRQIEEAENIRVLTQTKVIQSRGGVGDFHTVLEGGQGNRSTVDHGVTILATGGVQAPVNEYHHGESDRIFTQEAFEEALAQFKLPKEELNTIVMIQCVGSRDDQRPYCSRVCCASALKNALKVLERNKKAKVYIFYRDMMVYGFQETYYTQARAAGVIFIPYRPEEKPDVILDGDSPVVRFEDPILQRPFEIHADALVLSAGIVPSENETVAGAFGVERDEDGFFQEADAKWRPVDFMNVGVFVCGAAHSPRFIGESIAQARCAAQHALAILSKEALRSARVVADVEESICSLCKICIAFCPYSARTVDYRNRRIVIDLAACQGCGACAAACPSGAAFVHGLEDRLNFALIEAALEDEFLNI